MHLDTADCLPPRSPMVAFAASVSGERDRRAISARDVAAHRLVAAASRAVGVRATMPGRPRRRRAPLPAQGAGQGRPAAPRAVRLRVGRTPPSCYEAARGARQANTTAPTMSGAPPIIRTSPIAKAVSRVGRTGMKVTADADDSRRPRPNPQGGGRLRRVYFILSPGRRGAAPKGRPRPAPPTFNLFGR